MRWKGLSFLKPKKFAMNAVKWWFWRALIGIMIFWVLLTFFIPFSSVIANHFSGESWEYLWNYVLDVASGNLLRPFTGYFIWLETYTFSEPLHITWTSYFAWRILLFPTFLFLGYEFMLFILNPFFLAPQIFGDGREAIEEDVQKCGLFDGKHLFLGLFNGKKMKLPDTRSVFCIGCPSSGKTMGVIVPAILEEKDSSVIVHDPKGELAQLTSGYRSTLGPVFMLNWMGKDDPEKNIRWPSWNPIGEGNLPSLENGREGYIDTLVSYLIPDGPTGTDPYWVKTGRGCLTGLTGYLCGKVDQAKANDYFLYRLQHNQMDEADYEVLSSYYDSMRDFSEVEQARLHLKNKTLTIDNYLPIGSWDLIPDSWRGMDACFAMLLDIINNAQIQANHQISLKQKQQDMSALDMDAWQMIFEKIVLETAYYGYGRRTLLELNQVLTLPDKQRGSVVSMALSGVNIFKNAAVRHHTSLNDFNYEQLRGMKNEKTGKYEPVTVYMSVPFSDLNACVLLSSLFINMATQYLMEFGPNEGGAGPCPASFILDEFHHMPSLTSITDGIVFGRSKANKFLVCVQDWHQIKVKYDQETVDVLISAVAAKLIKRHNNPETRGPLLKGLESLTKVIPSYSSKRSFLIDVSGPLIPTAKSKMGFNLWWDLKRTVKKKADGVIGGSGILSMAPTKQLLLYSGHLNRPIRAETPLCFKHPEYKKLTSMKPAPKIPDYIERKADQMQVVGQIQFKPIIGED